MSLGYRLLARSRTALIHAERVSFLLAAARSYWSFLSWLTRIVRNSRSPFSTGGLPLPRFGASMAVIMYQQIIVDKPSLA
jgi:hypothetical protein